MNDAGAPPPNEDGLVAGPTLPDYAAATSHKRSSTHPTDWAAARRVSPEGLAFIKRFEGFAARPAPLPGGRWTIGHSHRMTTLERAQITPEEAEALLRDDLAPAEGVVSAYIFAPLSDAQFDALVSLAFNIGVTHFRTSAIVRALNAGRLLDAAGGFDDWRFALIDGGACEMEALARRRAAEKALFLSVEEGMGLAPTARLSPIQFTHPPRALNTPAPGRALQSNPRANGGDVRDAAHRVDPRVVRAGAERAPAIPASASGAPQPTEAPSYAGLLAHRFAPQELVARVRTVLGEAVTFARAAPAALSERRAAVQSRHWEDPTKSDHDAPAPSTQAPSPDTASTTASTGAASVSTDKPLVSAWRCVSYRSVQVGVLAALAGMVLWLGAAYELGQRVSAADGEATWSWWRVVIALGLMMIILGLYFGLWAPRRPERDKPGRS